MASVYLHIPFCERKCLYCDFFSVDDRSLQSAYVEALLSEIAATAGQDRFREVETVYLGGGTPSLLTPSDVRRVLEAISGVHTVATGAEITMEANPGTIGPENLAGYRAAGVNRLSIGVQSFHDRELAFLGRIHNADQGRESLRLARSAGFSNISIDLIYSLPGQRLATWQETLRSAAALEPDHISAYSLIVEEGTPLFRQVSDGTVVPNDTELEAEEFEWTMEFLRSAGYEQYEVSNYALSGRRSRHNESYWRHRDYLGYGPSAHSFRKEPGRRTGRRWWNVANLPEYLNRIRSGQTAVASGEHLGERELINERIFLGLRSDGLDCTRLHADFGVDLPEVHPQVFRRLTEAGLALWDERVLRLTDRGYLLCDEIAGYFLLA